MEMNENPKIFTIKRHMPILDDTGEHLNIKTFDFKRPSKFAKDHIRLMEMVHDSFSTIAETNISMQTRSMTEISLNMIEQKTFGEYIGSLPERCYAAILKSKSFKNNVVLQFRNETVFMVLDRLLGGKGQEKVSRELTEIEIILMEGVVREMLGSFKDAWMNVVDLDMEIESVETNPQFIRTVVSNEMCLVLNFSIIIEDEKSYFTFCLPFISIKPVLDKLDARSWFTDGKSIEEQKKNTSVSKNLNRIGLEAKVSLGEAGIYIDEIKRLEKGDVIRLKKGADRLLEMIIGEKPVFKVQPGLKGNNLAVQVMEIIR